jgi:exodeoxyribonuclease X
MPQSRVRVIDLETAGPSIHHVCEIGWQDVTMGDDGIWLLDPERGAAFVNPGQPISSATMAIHHITDADVAGAPFWKEAAPPILRPANAILALAAHRAAFEQRYCTPHLSGGAPWICTWKCALRLWPELPGFSNQMLRYERRPTGLIREIGLPAHRAMPDAYVTAHHLRDMLNQVSIAQLLAWSAEPGLLPRVPSGAERGKSWNSLSTEALTALARDREVDVRFSANRTAPQRRDQRAPRSAARAANLVLSRAVEAGPCRRCARPSGS